MNNKTTYYQKNKEKLLNRMKKYYKNNKERLRETEQEINTENYLMKQKA